MPTLQFKGKNIIWNHHMSVPYHTLDPIKDLDFQPEQSNGNLIVEGDNLVALKALLPQYRGRVKCIYIDPPYNTGNEGWAYNDNVNSPMISEWLGKEVNKEDLTKHDKWLCMMTPRLKLLKELLAEDGIIFISIDDNEVANLKNLMDEVFTESCFVTSLHIQMSSVQGQKVGAAKKGNIVKNAEYVLVYTNDGNKNVAKNILYDPTEYDTHYSLYLVPNEDGTYSERRLADVICEDDDIFEHLLLLGLASEKAGNRKITNDNIGKAYNLSEKFKKYIHESHLQITKNNPQFKLN